MKTLALTFALLATSAFAAEWTGYISDSKCGAGHVDGSAKSAACVKSCVKGGLKTVFVSDGKVIKIANTEKVPETLYGKKVTVTGDLDGDTVTIATIEAAAK